MMRRLHASLPDRQLRKCAASARSGILPSLPDRQLRKLMPPTLPRPCVVTAGQAAQKNPSRRPGGLGSVTAGQAAQKCHAA